MMHNMLINADARNLEFIERERVHLIFTSPPYYDVKDYGYTEQIGAGQTFPQFLSDMISVFSELDRVLVPGGRLAVNIATFFIPQSKTKIGHPLEINLPGIFTNIIERHTSLRRERHFVWHKLSGRKIKGKPYPYQVHIPIEVEFILIFAKPGHRTVSEEVMEQSKLSMIEWREFASPIWKIHRRIELPRGENSIHPCPFPPSLVDRVVKLYSFVGDLVFDPFCGIGNTCIGAVRNGRNFLGTDLNMEYLLEAKNRIIKMTGLMPDIFNGDRLAEGAVA